MKTKILISVLLALTIQSCINAQFKPKVTGSGNVISEERKAGHFNSIKVSTGIDVYLIQEDKESIVVEADDNLVEYIKTEIRNSTLKIYTDANIRNAKSMKVHVSIKELEKISVSSAGDVFGQGPFTANELFLSASSAGDIRLEVRADRIEVDISSSGDISLKGSTDILEADLSSAGDLKAYELEARVATISTSSAGDARIFVTEELKARASSAGDIYFKGDPPQVDGHASSGGEICRK